MNKNIGVFEPDKYYKAKDVMDRFTGSSYFTILNLLKNNKVPYVTFTDSDRARRWYTGADLNQVLKFNTVMGKN